MAENSKIQWTDHTFNPWSGCTKVHAGCANCYAEVNYSVKMRGVKWGPNGTRVLAADGMWREPLKWDRQAKKAGERRRVFCASLADVFEDWNGPLHDAHGNTLEHPEGSHSLEYGDRSVRLGDVRRRLFELIDATPNLDWLLLTKRPESVRRMYVPHLLENVVGHVRQNDGDGKVIRRRENVWLGTSVSDQETADKFVPELLKCRDLAPVLFVSAEPLLGPIEFGHMRRNEEDAFNALDGIGSANLDWVIVGGESGPKSRRCDGRWVRSLVKQCAAAGVATFVKQFGAYVVDRNDSISLDEDTGTYWPEPLDVRHNINGFREEYQGADCRLILRDRKGGDPAEWPEELRVREMPFTVSP